MSRVFKAHDPRFDREVAVKVLHGHLMSDPAAEKRFTNEARTIAQLESSAIVPVYDFGRFEDTAFIVMRLMSGGTLQERLKAGKPSLLFIDELVKRMCSALDRAHDRGVIHRDLKPANILFDEDGMSYLADFGIARMSEGTQTTSIMGTANYMAPEQAQGKPLDARTDVYQLAVILFEMLTGHQPYEGETTASVLYQHVYEPIPRLTTYEGVLSNRFQTLIDSAMAKEIDQRPASAGEFYDLFKLARGGEGDPLLETAFDPQLTRPQPAAETIVDNGALPAAESLGSAETIIDNQPISPPLKTEHRSRPAWLIPAAAAGAAVILLALAWGSGFFATTPTLESTPGATQVVVIVTQVVPNPAGPATNTPEPAAAAPLTPTNTPQPLPTEVSTTAPPPADAPPLSDQLGGGSGMMAFASNESGNYDIYIGPVDGQTGPVRQLTTDRANDFGPQWSPDGRWLLFHTFRDGDWELYIMDSGGGRLRNLTRALGDDAFGNWSSNGEWIAFHSNRDGDFDIYLIRPDGSDIQQLTSNGIDDFGPRWSPDGQLIAFHRRIEGQRQIFVMRSDGSAVQQLTSPPNEHIFPQWTPDGERLVFQTIPAEDVAEITIMNRDGSELQNLTPPGQNGFFPSVSQDGLWILYHGQRGSEVNRDLYLLPLNGGSPQRLTSSSFGERMPVWQPIVR